MSKSLLVALVVTLVAVPSLSQAQFEPGQTLVNFNVNYVNGEVRDFEKRYDGWGVNGSFEKFLTNSAWSIGFAIAWVTAGLETEVQPDSTQIRGDVSMTPLMVTFRYNFGNTWFRPYVGLGAGISSATVTKVTNSPTVIDRETRGTDSSPVFSIPLGAMFRISDHVLINANYMPLIVTRNDVSEGVSHVVSVGVAFLE